MRQQLGALGFTDIKLYGWDLKGDTQAIIARKGDVVVCVFRGTQERGDIGADLPATNSEKDPDLSGSEVQGTVFDGAEVHRGFRDSLAEVWDPDQGGTNGERLIAAGQKPLLWTLQQEASKPGTKFLFTGHSLGGAQATLAAAYVSLQNPARSSRVTMLPNVASVVTFGSPKVGNSKFAEAFDRTLGPVTHSFEHNGDLVRAMPPLPSYRHVGLSNLIKLEPADSANAPSAISSHRMNYYVERLQKKAAAEAAANGTPIATTQRVVTDGFDIAT